MSPGMTLSPSVALIRLRRLERLALLCTVLGLDHADGMLPASLATSQAHWSTPASPPCADLSYLSPSNMTAEPTPGVVRIGD
eukprot:CAMPEP_0194514064 /NCGR_PEP_ID=MMETSP0253-20130528/46413_1 /TAXON_ID=2966 /ORGANISM="Noctiluca scintillans" /LENGTH=81 /DNA_ID=CAMNT_0039357671 /DNA_START=572 /DNA_END=817 /DNA_ORIENTATION=-